jgi:hypothetical protein
LYEAKFSLVDDIPLRVGAYSWLGDVQHRKLLRITPEQEAKLREVSPHWQEDDAQWWQSVLAARTKQPPGETPKEGGQDEMQHYRKQAEDSRKRIEKILTERQLDACKEYSFYAAATKVVVDSEVSEANRGFTRLQYAKLGQLRHELVRQSERDTQVHAAQILALLTARQQKMLRCEFDAIERQTRQARDAEAAGYGGNNGVPVPVLSSGITTYHAIGGGAVETAEEYYVYLPDYRELAKTTVREQLHLTDRQRKQLLKVADDFRTGYQELMGQATKGAGPYPQLGFYKSQLALEKKFGRRIEALLTPPQSAQLKDFRFLQAVFDMLQDPLVQDKVGMNQTQQSAAAEVWYGSPESECRRDRENYEKLIGMLTPSQQEKLRQALRQEPGWFVTSRVRLQLLP